MMTITWPLLENVAFLGLNEYWQIPRNTLGIFCMWVFIAIHLTEARRLIEAGHLIEIGVYTRKYGNYLFLK